MFQVMFFFIVPNLCPCISTRISDFLDFPECFFLPAFRKHACACCIAGGESTNDSNSKRQSCCRWGKARATSVCCSLVCWDHWMHVCCLRDESFSLNLEQAAWGKISPPLLLQHFSQIVLSRCWLMVRWKWNAPPDNKMNIDNVAIGCL